MKIQLCLVTIGRKHSLPLVLRCIKKCEKIGEIEYFAFNAGAKKEIREWLEKEGFKVIDIEQEPIDHHQLHEVKEGETREHAKEIKLHQDLVKKKDQNVIETYKVIQKNILPDADYVWFIEDDQPFPPDTLPKYLEVFEKYPDAWVVAVVSYNYWHTVRRVWRNFWNIKIIEMDSKKLARMEEMEYKGQPIEKIGATGTGNLLVKREAVVDWAIGTHCENLGGVDIDFFSDLAKKGRSVYGRWDVISPHMTIYEDGSVELVGRIQKNLYPIIFGSND